MRAASSHTRPGRSSERRAALLSCAAHALLALGLVWLGARQRGDAPALATRASAAAPVAIEIEIDIEIAPVAPAPAPAPPPATASPARPAPAAPSAVVRIAPAPAQPRAPRARAATATPPAAPAPMPPVTPAPTPPVTPAPSAAPPALLSMRGSDRARPATEPSAPVVAPRDTGAPGERAAGPEQRAPGSVPGDLSPAHAARLVAPDPGPPPSSPLALPGPPPAAPDVRDAWAPAGEGTYRLDDLAFTAQIARDGTVTIDDKPSLQLTPNLPRVREDPLHPGNVLLMMDIAKFDVTDWVMRRSGMDPYAARKARFLDQSRDVRADMRAEARRENLRDALAELPDLLDAVWRDPGRTVAERRELMFLLWDECTESGSDELVAASRTARATILGFIRRTLPPGSPDAYTAAELDALNAARKSTQQFAPYP